MYTRIALSAIKQEAKNLKNSNSELKHTQALNKIAKKYGYEKFEILKSKAKNCNGEQSILIYYDDKKNTYLSGLYDQNFIVPRFSDFKNRKVAIIGSTSAGKTSLLLSMHEDIDNKSTLIIDSQKKSVFNKDIFAERKRKASIKYFGRQYPFFENISFADFDSKNIDIESFKTIIVDEGWQIPTGSNLHSEITKAIMSPNKTVVITFQTINDAKRFGVKIIPIEEFRSSTNKDRTLSLYAISSISVKTQIES